MVTLYLHRAIADTVPIQAWTEMLMEVQDKYPDAWIVDIDHDEQVGASFVTINTEKKIKAIASEQLTAIASVQRKMERNNLEIEDNAN